MELTRIKLFRPDQSLFYRKPCRLGRPLARISDDGSGHYNPDLSEGPWGGGVMTLHGGAQSSRRPDTERDNRSDHEAREGRMQTGRPTAHVGSRLKLLMIQEGTAWKASLPAVLAKPPRTQC